MPQGRGSVRLRRQAAGRHRQRTRLPGRQSQPATRLAFGERMQTNFLGRLVRGDLMLEGLRGLRKGDRG